MKSSRSVGLYINTVRLTFSMNNVNKTKKEEVSTLLRAPHKTPL